MSRTRFLIVVGLILVIIVACGEIFQIATIAGKTKRLNPIYVVLGDTIAVTPEKLEGSFSGQYHQISQFKDYLSGNTFRLSETYDQVLLLEGWEWLREAYVDREGIIRLVGVFEDESGTCGTECISFSFRNIISQGEDGKSIETFLGTFNLSTSSVEGLYSLELIVPGKTVYESVKVCFQVQKLES